MHLFAFAWLHKTVLWGKQIFEPKFCISRNVAQETTTGGRYVNVNAHGQIELKLTLPNFASDPKIWLNVKNAKKTKYNLVVHFQNGEKVPLQTPLQLGHKLGMKSDTVVLEPTLPGVGHNWMQSGGNTQMQKQNFANMTNVQIHNIQMYRYTI